MYIKEQVSSETLHSGLWTGRSLMLQATKWTVTKIYTHIQEQTTSFTWKFNLVEVVLLENAFVYFCLSFLSTFVVLNHFKHSISNKLFAKYIFKYIWFYFSVLALLKLKSLIFTIFFEFWKIRFRLSNRFCKY